MKSGHFDCAIHQINQTNLRFRFGVRICCCDGVCWEPARVRRDGVIGSRFGVCDPEPSLRARLDGVLFSFGVDILLELFTQISRIQ